MAPREGKVRKRRSQTRKSRLEAEGTKPRQQEKEDEKHVAGSQSQTNPDTRGRLCLTHQQNRRGGGVDAEHKTDWREGEEVLQGGMKKRRRGGRQKEGAKREVNEWR